MKKGKKVYKKFLSCVLAATMVVTSGVVYPGNEKTAEAAGGVEYSFSVDGNKWCIISEEDGVGLLLDAQGVIYQLDENGTTVYGFGYDESGVQTSGTVVIPDTVPIDYTDYVKYKNSKELSDGQPINAFNTPDSRSPSTVTGIADKAFSGSSSLTEVTVPQCVKSIGDKAFASCPELTKLDWKVTDSESVQIGNDAGNWNTAKILENSPKCILSSENTSVQSYAQANGYTSPRTDNSQDTPSVPEPIQTPTATPTSTPSQIPVVTPSQVPTVAPTATPEVPVSYPPIVVTPAPSVEPATPTPVVATPPVEQTPMPGETAVPTEAPTAVPDTPVLPSEKPAITEVPEPSSPVTTLTPSDSTPVPVPPTIAPTQSETVVKNNVTYEVEQNKKSVSVGDMKDVKSSSVTIPATVKVNGVSYPVTSVDKGAFKNNTNIKKVKLGKNIKNIEADAFRGCKNLTSVSLPSNLQTVEKNSFNGCSSLKSVKLPKTVKKIGKAAFKDCTSMKNVTIGDNPKAKKGGLSLDGKQVRYGASTVTINIGEKAFENCKKLNKVIINALVKIIGKSAFKDCKSLRSVLIYSKVLKKVKGGALTGVHNCKISVPAKKVGPYKILFKNKGQGKKVVVAKF